MTSSPVPNRFLWEIPALGTLCTWLMPFPAPMPRLEQPPARSSPGGALRAINGRCPLPNRGGFRPCRFPSPASRKRKNSAGIWLLPPAPAGRRMRNLLLHPDNFEKNTSLAGTDRPQPGREKKEAAKPEKKAVLPAVKTETSPNRKTPRLLPRPETRNSRKTPPSISSGERKRDAPDILKDESAASPAQTDCRKIRYPGP